MCFFVQVYAYKKEGERDRDTWEGGGSKREREVVFCGSRGQRGGMKKL